MLPFLGRVKEVWRKYASMQAFWPGLVLSVALLTVIGVRIRLAPSPLERDEGEYAYMGQLMLQGVPPYKEAANMKFPGTYAVYAVIEAVFGQSATGIHYGLLVANLITSWLIYRFARSFFSCRSTALMSAAVYALSSLSYSFLGPMGHATHFVVLFGMAGLVVLVKGFPGMNTGWLLAAGLLAGVAYMAKQSGFYFVVFGSMLILREHGWRRISMQCFRALMFFGLGAFAPFAGTVFILYRLECLSQFTFWAFKYASHYGASPSEALEMFKDHAGLMYKFGFGWILILPAFGLFFLRNENAKVKSEGRWLAALFLLISLGGVSLGLVFRPHYWVQLLPAMALAAAGFFSNAAEVISRRWKFKNESMMAALLCLGFCGMVMTGEAKYFFSTPPQTIIREVYKRNPFNETVFVADYLKKHNEPADRVFVFGSEPQIFFYSQLRSATSFIYLFSLFEEQPYAQMMQQEMRQEVEKVRPRYIVDVGAGDPIPGMEETPLYRWKKDLLTASYRPVFLVDVYLNGDRVIMGEAVRNYRSGNGVYTALWERKDSQ